MELIHTEILGDDIEYIDYWKFCTVCGKVIKKGEKYHEDVHTRLPWLSQETLYTII